jgi:hypothetical protein
MAMQTSSPTKACSWCGEIKPLGEYHKRAASRDGVQRFCKECASTRSKRRHLAGRPNPVKHPERSRASYLKSEYGITVEEYDRLLALQAGVCAVCGQEERAKNKKTLAVDHDHVTGAVRGLLCHSCNIALGMLGDDPARIARLREYLVERTMREELAV